MLTNGTLAIAIVKRQVMVVQATRSHTTRDKYLDVNTFSLFGDGVFLASDVPKARIASSDVLTIFPSTHVASQGLLELPKQAFSEFVEISSRYQKRYESLWNSWISKH
ncbi:uncharacterized protein LACBIDRAFT_294818 [Laccaria bicolor S238N-H82]|uniref:Predicted protein n=1 Tax=Laccaria bicolor (strain S238N-H82 / ATCC MYA-4686) TaxID=486041 RepID=B0DIF0_LACBS|nr:uncharacterized protein LACBIDRAFT_294818 [Laccaria bicolor S238N-H82]EDR05554.1 predicted protein [Laccaria bicolor S238N-H82]|eukprot:XP_001883658.1 predicted protein [Laccaria bicolor S238N-H82]